jgi:hypothetical protein
MSETIPAKARVLINTAQGVFQGWTCEALPADSPNNKAILVSVDYDGGYLARREHIIVLEASNAS